MHAKQIVQRFIDAQLGAMHAARRRVLIDAVRALIQGHRLSLSRLGRGMLGVGTLKAAIKRVDRLIGHERIEQEARLSVAGRLERLCALRVPLVIAVDWSAVAPGGRFVELRAAVSFLGMGRAMTIYQQVYPLCQLGSARAERALLKQLHAWITPGTRVSVITDAGFRRPWFAQVERLGWSWIGRIRRGVKLSRDGKLWELANVWFAQATGCAQRWSGCYLTRKAAWPCELVLVHNAARERKAYRCPGHGSSAKAAKEARASAAEPWLLAHSASLNAYRPDEIVALYAQRMHIEQCFRDAKSNSFGMGLEIGRSRSVLRLHALLLIATLAAFVLWHIGQLAEAEGLHQRYKATTRAQRELSFINLAMLICQLPHFPLSEYACNHLLQRLGVRQ